MVKRRQAGYTLMEMVVAVAVFSAIVAIFAIITAEMRNASKHWPVNFMRHPQVSAMLTRMRRDVVDAHGANPYPANHDGYTQSPKTLIIESVQPSGGVNTIVWDLREPGIVTRRAYNVGVATDWVARGLPAEFTIESVTIEGRPFGVRIKATDSEGNLAIDQILQPRAHN